jgi:hypothetical protein
MFETGPIRGDEANTALMGSFRLTPERATFICVSCKIRLETSRECCRACIPENLCSLEKHEFLLSGRTQCGDMDIDIIFLMLANLKL